MTNNIKMTVWSNICLRVKTLMKRENDQNITPIKYILLRGKWPILKSNKHSPLERILLTLPLVGRIFSLSNLVAFINPDGKRAYLLIDLYVAISAVTLTVVLLFENMISSTVGLVLVMFIAAYRVFDIISYQLSNILVDSQVPKWRPISIQRTYLFALINLYEIIIAFAIIYLAFARNTTESGSVICTPFQSFCYSFLTLSTLGFEELGYGKLVLTDNFSRVTVIMQIMTEILFILAIVPGFVANLASQLIRKENIESKVIRKKKK